MDINSAQIAFLNECRDLLQEMESALLELEKSPADPELINAVFRSAHTIKGTSGVFGYDEVEAFTHVVESVLDRVRSKEIDIEGNLIAILLSCRDFVEILVELAVSEQSQTREALAQGQSLLDQLKTYLNDSQDRNTDHDSGSSALVETTDETVREEQPVCNDNWHISVRYSPEVLTHGMDPMSFLRYLTRLGEIVHVTTITNALPSYEDFNPEQCYLGFEIDFASDASKKDIEQVFEFVREDCVLRLLPPKASINKYVDLINVLEEENLRIGEILIRGNALTERELDEALRIQNSAGKENHPGGGAAPQLGEVLVNQNMVHREVVDAAVDKQQKLRKSVGKKTVRVDADKLDSLVNLVGEMVIAGAGTSLLAHSRGDDELIESISVISRLVEEIRDSALRLRMVQIGETFSRFQRVVRDVSRELGKDINLVISGGETELDKTVVEKIGDPLMHLVRNAMDHGIEPAEVRLARGKDAHGTLYLNAYHDSGSIVIEVADNGGGLNKEVILEKAVAKGLVHPDQKLQDNDIYRLVFEAGFSTAQQISNLSGRGVGMDVVKKNIESLRGTVDIESRPQEGTKVIIRLPLTLAIIDGFLINIADAAYVIPLDMVFECIEVSEAELQQTKHQNYINLRGEVLPLLRLREYFQISDQPGKRENIVVVQSGGVKTGIVVDELLGEFQTVIKPLGKLFERLKGISGATILGSGEVAVILDVPGLVQQVAEREGYLSNRIQQMSPATTLH